MKGATMAARGRHPLGLELRQHREDFDGTGRDFEQSDVALAIDMSQSTVSQIETGLKDITGWRPEALYDLLLAYKYDPSSMLDLAERHDLQHLRDYISENTHLFKVQEGRQRVKFAGRIGAGRISTSFVEDEVSYRWVPDRIVDRYRLEDVLAVEVDGDSMISNDVRDSIPPLSTVYIHTKLQPAPGEIVCVYLPNEDHTVLKKWAPKDGYAVLQSLNSQHEPIIVKSDTKATLQGVYLTHVPIGPRLT